MIQKQFKAGLKTFLTLFAFTFDRILEPNKGILEQYANREEMASAVWCFLGVGIFCFFSYVERHLKHKTLQKSELCCALFFAVSMLIGKSFSLFNNWNLILADSRQLLCSVISLIGWTVLFYTLLTLLTARQLNLEKQSHSGLLDFREERFLPQKLFGIMAAGWLPYLIATWPGSVPHDSMWQISMWLGFSEMNNHHPWLTTAIFGTLMRIGQLVSDNMGIFLIVAFQIVLCSATFTLICLKVRRYGGSALYTALFFAVVPLWGCFVSAVLKDMLFTAIYAVYFCCMLNLFHAGTKGKSVNPKDWIFFLILNLLVCLIRSDGIYRIMPTGLILCAAVKQYRKELIACLLLCCVLFKLYNYISFDVIGIKEGSKREMLSIPFQQTARYVRDLEDDVTPEEKAAINAILPYEELGELYNPELSDPIKNRMKSVTVDEFKHYLNAWLAMGLRHPGVYIQATLNNTYSYFYPFRNSRVMAAYQNYIKGEPVNPGLDIYYVNYDARDAVIEYAELWRVLPALSLLSNPAFYTWLFATVTTWIIKKKFWRHLAILSIPAIHLAICVASPVNGLLRYALPLMACMPLLWTWAKHECRLQL